MSVTATSRTFWTDFPELGYINKKGKRVAVKASTAKVVLLAIADNADDFGENSFQSFETLARKSSVERRSVMRVVRALIEAGYLKVAGLSVYGTNNYTVVLEKLGNPPPRRTKTGRPKSDDSTPLVLKSGDSEAKSGDPEAESGDSTPPDPSLTVLKSLSGEEFSNEEKPKTRTGINQNHPAYDEDLADLGWAIAGGKPLTERGLARRKEKAAFEEMVTVQLKRFGMNWPAFPEKEKEVFRRFLRDCPDQPLERVMDFHRM